VQPIETIAIASEHASTPTGNVLPLLHEIKHALKALAERGTEYSIDLNSLPLAPQEDDALERLLGLGEVQARLTALGVSEIVETAVPGVWRVTHRDSNDNVVGRFIEVTVCPAILKSQQEDLAGGITQLERMIGEQD
jgi:hydrogenase-1 operon protein HyaF